jgi:stress up-regulated protein Nod 19
MRRRKSRLHVLAFLLTVIALLGSSWGSGTSSAQEHDHPEDPADPPPPDPGDPTQPPDIGERPAAERTSVVRYGPYSIDPAPENPDGTHGHAHSGNQFAFGVQKPCSDCYITGMIPDLVDAQGNSVGVHDDVQLHHMVLFNAGDGRTDATCGTSFLGFLGQRFFASGDERTPIVAQPGYGYYVGNGSFNLIWDLASMSRERETVSYQVTFLWMPASEAGDMTDLEPVWFDVDQCGDSNIDLPAGQSTRTWTWNANRVGDIVGIGGHLHNGGVNIQITNDSTGQTICDSVAGYGETPMYVDHHGNEWLSSMSTCGGATDPDFASPVASGNRITIRANYDMPEAVPDQMGIVVAFVTREEAGCPWWLSVFGWC